jgi:RNA polymerase sigma-70 factor (ECF subfamily)
VATTPSARQKQQPAFSEGAHAGADADLVIGLRRGEPRAFDLAYARYRVRIYGFLLRLSGQKDVADDLFQETFLQLARHATRLHPDTDLAAFLYTVARNRYRSHRRMSLFRLSKLREIFSEKQHEAAGPTTGQTPLEAAVASDRVARIEQALAKLSLPLREALILVAVQGIDQDAAAQILGIKPAALRQRLSRARAELAEKLGEHDGA